MCCVLFCDLAALRLHTTEGDVRHPGGVSTSTNPRSGTNALRIRNLTLHVNDDVAPALANGRGALRTSAGWLSGTQTAGFDAAAGQESVSRRSGSTATRSPTARTGATSPSGPPAPREVPKARPSEGAARRSGARPRSGRGKRPPGVPRFVASLGGLRAETSAAE